MIKVSEHFLSFQGEGATVGKRAVFLRTSGCVCDCEWCDTAEVWKKGEEISEEKLGMHFKAFGYTEALKRGAHLILTGGDPLIWQKSLAQFVRILESEVKYLTVEVETEAMIMPAELLNFVNFWNVSPKLSNAKTKPVNEGVLKFHVSNKLGYTCFKFVVGNKEDVEEAVEMCRKYGITCDKAYLMPQADNREAFIRLAPEICELALKYAFNFSPREHLTIWDRKTGV